MRSVCRFGRVLLCFVGLLCSAAYGDYARPKNNHELLEELQGDSNRKIPELDWLRVGVDGETWFRGMNTQDFYHGVGYWIQARTEIQPNEFLFINTRTIFYSGSSSQGYANPTGSYSLIGFTGLFPSDVLYSRLSIRIVDLERQTIGYGLLVQDREMNGALVILKNDYYSFRILGDSTGALVAGDDMLNAEFKILGGWFGGGATYWTQGRSQSGLARNRDPYFYLLSTQSFLGDRWSYGLEAAQRNDVESGLVALSYQDQFGGLNVKSRIEARAYKRGFGQDFVGQIENQYVSYDQYYKAYTNPMSFFVISDNVDVYGLQLDLHYDFNHHWHLESLNEVGRFDYKDFAKNDFYFYRVGITYCPLIDRDECITFFASNKVLNDSYSRPPNDTAASNLPLFKKYDFLAVEARFRF